MKANFIGRVESNHSAFIRIKTNKENKGRDPPELLILPLEIEVSSGIIFHLMYVFISTFFHS